MHAYVYMPTDNNAKPFGFIENCMGGSYYFFISNCYLYGRWQYRLYIRKKAPRTYNILTLMLKF